MHQEANEETFINVSILYKVPSSFEWHFIWVQWFSTGEIWPHPHPKQEQCLEMFLIIRICGEGATGIQCVGARDAQDSHPR